MKTYLTGIAFERIEALSGKRSRIHYFAFCMLLFLSSLCSQSAHADESFRTAVANTISAFTDHEFLNASVRFEELEQTYGKEKEYKSDSLQKVVLPAWGHAYRMSKQPAKAVDVFKRYLKQFPSEQKRKDFILHSLALAHMEAGSLDKALSAFDDFIEAFPYRNESSLAWIEQAKILFELSKNDEAFHRLEAFYNNPKHEERFRIQGQLLALKKANELGEVDRSKKLLLETRWSINSMPEIAVLAFAAIRVGDQLSRTKDYSNALKAYRLVPPKDILIQLQKERLESTKNEGQHKVQSYRHSPSGTFWSKYYNELIAKINGQLKGLYASEDYTPSFLLRYGQCFLLLERAREAWIIFEDLAQSEKSPVDIKREAHFRWIIAARSLKRWDDALSIARKFVEAHPDSNLAPKALFLSAEAYQEMREYEKAIAVLTELLDNYPTNELSSRWLFVRGFNYTLIHKNLKAREDFASYMQQHPNGIIYAQASLWHALTFYFEKDYPSALKQFDQLLATIQSHPILPEVKYRKASTLYAMRKLEDALISLNDYLQKHPMHMRVPEANALRGDILMGLSRLNEALESFRKVGPEAKGLFPYSVFQIGKIYKARAGAWEHEQSKSALKDYDAMIVHFQNYVDRNDVPNKSRISEALYWIGFARIQKGEIDKAFPAFLNALNTYGNDKNATEISLILNALNKLHQRYMRDRKLSPNTRSILETGSFTEWLRAERKKAFEANRLTYSARLSIYLSDRLRKKSPTEAESLLIEAWERTPMEMLSAEALGRIGLFVLDVIESKYASKKYFDELLEKFESSPARAYAYYGLAKIDFEKHHKGDRPASKQAITRARNYLSRIRTEMPMHPLMPEASILLGELLTATGEFESAQNTYESLLKIKHYRGRPHATALIGLSNMMKAKGEKEKSIAYAQRVYTVYRAYPKLLAKAYLSSAQQFESIGKPGIAYRTYAEMLDDERLKGLSEYTEAKKAHARLDAELPLEIKKAPSKHLESHKDKAQEAS